MLRKTGQTEEGKLVLHKPLFNAEHEDCRVTRAPQSGETLAQRSQAGTTALLQE